MSKRARGPIDPSEVASSEALSKAVLADLIARDEQHASDGTLPRGPRGYFYDLRPNGMGNGVVYHKKASGESKAEYVARFGPMAAHLAYVEDVLGRARRAELIDEDHVADGRAPSPLIPVTYPDAEHFARKVVADREQFFLDAQQFQPIYIEVLCEAADLRERLSRVAIEYGVPVYAGGGMSGIKGKRRMGERARWRRAMGERALRHRKPTVVFQIGDRDTKGEDIYTNAAEDSIGWVEKALVKGRVVRTGDTGHVYAPGAPLADLIASLDEHDRVIAGYGSSDEHELPRLSFFRLALSPEQAKPLGILDKRGKAEADAIPVPTLDGWLRDALEGLQDSACRTAFERQQDEQRQRLPEVVRAALDPVSGGEGATAGEST